MKYEITAMFDEEFVRRTTRRFLLKSLGWDYFAAFFILLAIFIGMLGVGKRDWMVGALGTIVFFGFAIAVTVWCIYMRRALSTFRKMQTPEVRFAIDASGISVSSELGSGSINWQAIQKMWCLPEAWLLFVSKGAYSTIPTACLPPEAKQLIVDKLTQHGAKISQRTAEGDN